MAKKKQFVISPIYAGLRYKRLDKIANAPLSSRMKWKDRTLDEVQMRKNEESRNHARKLIRKAGGLKAKSNRRMRQEWAALLEQEEKRKRKLAEEWNRSIEEHIVYSLRSNR